MDRVRLGIIGMGGMGSAHAQNVLTGKIRRCELTAISDADGARLGKFPQLRGFATGGELIRSGLVDAVLIATPHFAHPALSIEAFQGGRHVLVEKPVAVHKADAERMIAAHRETSGLVFAAMFNMRTVPWCKKFFELVRSGELGEVRRVNWIATTWFRTHAYYASGTWRATWAGEGGGVLLNQCPHNLDFLQWVFGMPARIRAFCRLGRYHNIEVEDDVTAYLEYPNGATAVFVASTGEAPGTNRLEVTGENGRLVYENDALTFLKNQVPTSEFSRTDPSPFGVPATTTVRIPVEGNSGQHAEILQNFVDAILDGAPLIAPGEEGIHSVELANAMLYSSLQNRTVELPLDGAAYERQLQELIAKAK